MVIVGSMVVSFAGCCWLLALCDSFLCRRVLVFFRTSLEPTSDYVSPFEWRETLGAQLRSLSCQPFAAFEN